MSAAAEMRVLAAQSGPQVLAYVEQLQTKVGQVVRVYEFVAAGEARVEQVSKLAYDRVHTEVVRNRHRGGGNGISVWRSLVPGEARRFMVLMGEEGSDPLLERCGLKCAQLGGVQRGPEAMGEQQLAALRARRWDSACEGILKQLHAGVRTPSGTFQEAHYGLGARIVEGGRVVLVVGGEGS